MRGGLATLAAVLCCHLATVASAQSPVDSARELYEAGNLNEALDAYAQIEQREDLSLDNLAEIFQTRALIYRILGDEGAEEAELTRLASIAPDHRFSSDVPPEVRERFATLRARLEGSLTLSVQARSSAESVTLVSNVENDPLEVVRSVVLRGRIEGADWVRGEGTLQLEAEIGDLVEYYAAAVGPGGAIVARHGSQADPRAYRVEGQGGGGAPVWPWIVAGAGVVAVAVTVTIIVVLSSGETLTQPTAPMETM